MKISPTKQILGYTAAVDNIWKFVYVLLEIFGVIFFYDLFAGDIFLALFVIACAFLITALSNSFMYKLIGKIGTRNSLYVFVLLVLISTSLLFAYSQFEILVFGFIWIFVLALARSIITGSIMYITGQNTSHETRGSDIGMFFAVGLISSVLAPIFGAFIGDLYGLDVVYVAAGLILLLSAIPISRLPNYKFDYQFRFGKVWQSVRGQKIIRTNIIRFLPQQWAIQLWTLYIFLSVDSLSRLGVIVAVTTGISLISVAIFSKLLDRERNIPFRIASVINGFVNLGRAFFVQVLPIPIWDYLGRLGELLRGQTGLTNSYDLITDKVAFDHRDELVSLHSTTYNFFIAVGLIIAGLIVKFFGFELAFLIAGFLNFLAFFVEFDSDQFRE